MTESFLDDVRGGYLGDFSSMLGDFVVSYDGSLGF